MHCWPHIWRGLALAFLLSLPAAVMMAMSCFADHRRLGAIVPAAINSWSLILLALLWDYWFPPIRRASSLVILSDPDSREDNRDAALNPFNQTEPSCCITGLRTARLHSPSAAQPSEPGSESEQSRFSPGHTHTVGPHPASQQA